jgi:hypothetical protein
MSDIVERLEHCSHNTKDEYLHELTGRAAAEITRLRAELARVTALGEGLARSLRDANGLIDDLNDLVNELSGTRSFAAKMANEKYFAALAAWQGRGDGE